MTAMRRDCECPIPNPDCIHPADDRRTPLDVLGDRVNSVIALHHINRDGYCCECSKWDVDEGWLGSTYPCTTVQLLTGQADA